MDESFILLITGVLFLFILFWETRKDRAYLFELEKRLEEKEKKLLELYEAVENIIQSTFPELEVTINDDKIKSAMPQQQDINGSPLQNIRKGSSDTDYHYKRKAVILMYKEGNTEEEIAKKLGIGKGEVRLILGLKEI